MYARTPLWLAHQPHVVPDIERLVRRHLRDVTTLPEARLERVAASLLEDILDALADPLDVIQEAAYQQGLDEEG